MAPKVPITPVNIAPQGERLYDHRSARGGSEAIDEDVDADVNAGAHTKRGAELGHPYEHDCGELVRPGEINRGEGRVDPIGGAFEPQKIPARPPNWRAPPNCSLRNDAGPLRK